MGIIYKLMKHQRRLEMLNPNAGDSNETDIALDTHVQDKRIKAEHILEFCKILVETSNSAKSVKRKRQPKQNLTSKNHHDHSGFQPRSISNHDKELQVQTISEMMVEERAPETPTDNSQTKDSLLTKERKRHRINNSPSRFSISLKDPEKEEGIITSIEPTPNLHSATFSPANTLICHPLQNRQFHNQQSCKKDILQKIRNQILERKRQRQLASVQPLNGVWRPW